MPRQNYSATVESWRRIFDSLDETTAELPHIEMPRAKLAAIYERVVELHRQQAALTAAKQAATKEIEELLEEGRMTATSLRFNLKEHYGNRSPKLIEHGVQPFRGGRPRKKREPSSGG